MYSYSIEEGMVGGNLNQMRRAEEDINNIIYDNIRYYVKELSIVHAFCDQHDWNIFNHYATKKAVNLKH